MSDEQPVRSNDPHVYSLDLSLPKDEFERELGKRMLFYKALAAKNPHPMFIAVPNPAWQEWMDEHKEQDGE